MCLSFPVCDIRLITPPPPGATEEGRIKVFFIASCLLQDEGYKERGKCLWGAFGTHSSPRTAGSEDLADCEKQVE